MSFVSSAVRGVGQALGLVSRTPKTPDLGVVPTLTSPGANGQASASAQMDVAAQTAAAGIQRGRTSTMLTGGQGTTEDQKYTSKILLGQ